MAAEQLNTRYIALVCSVAALGGLLFGYDWVVIGGAKPFYEAYFALTSSGQIGWANSCALLGCLLGSLFSGGVRILQEHLGVGGTFWLYAAICTAGFFFVRAKVPETKGKTLEQIEAELSL